MIRAVFSLLLSFVVAFVVGWYAHSWIGSVYFHWGKPRIIDGDTIGLGRNIFDLEGIEAPDPETPAGVQAADYLLFVTTGKFVWCRHFGDIEQGHLVSKCYGGLQNLQERMVSEGFARDCPVASGGKYAVLEARTEQARRGLWADGSMPEVSLSCLPSDASEDVVPQNEDEAEEADTDGLGVEEVEPAEDAVDENPMVDVQEQSNATEETDATTADEGVIPLDEEEAADVEDTASDADETEVTPPSPSSSDGEVGIFDSPGADVFIPEEGESEEVSEETSPEAADVPAETGGDGDGGVEAETTPTSDDPGTE